MLIEADPIVDAHRPGGIVVGVLLRMDTVIRIPHLIDRLSHLAGKHALGRRGRIVIRSLWLRELITAVGTGRVAGGNERMTLGTLLCWHFGAFAVFALLLHADLIDRTVTQNVAAKVQHEAILLPRAQSEPTPDLLVEEPGRERWPQ